MKPIDFPQSNKTLLKPETMTDEECGSLPVYTDGQVCISLWKPTWRERLSMLVFGRVWLWVYYGETQPPVAIETHQTIWGKKQ
jgi:hypothetical protein